VKKIGIIYQSDEEYIKKIILFFNIECLKGKGNIEFYGIKWDSKENFEREILKMSNNFIVEKVLLKFSPKFEKVLVLSLIAKEEIKVHKKISAFFKKNNIFQLNPFSSSLKADNKYYTIKKLEKNRINVPKCILLEWEKRGEIEKILKEFLIKNRIENFYIQPNWGTEGRETYFFTSKYFFENKKNVLETIFTILQGQSVIIKEERGNVFFYNEKEKGYRQIVFRVLLWKFNNEIMTDYGFVEIANDNLPITSVEKEGKIIRFKDIFLKVFYREKEEYKRLILTSYDIDLIKKDVLNVYYAFNYKLKELLNFMGIDFLLEFKEGKVIPVFLEINPRPSGINKLEKFDFEGKMSIKN